MLVSSKNKILNNLYTLKSIGFRYMMPLNINKIDSINIDLPNDLDKVQDIVNNCNLCSLGNSSRDKIFGIGDKNAKLIFISTTPIFNNEDFDTILNSMLNNILKISKNDIYLLAILKCNVNDKISNLSHEISICKDYLVKQLELLEPKLIVTLGDSYNYLLNDNSEISTIRGTMLKYNNIDLLPIYHPNLLLRNPSLKKETLGDLKKIRLLMDMF